MTEEGGNVARLFLPRMSEHMLMWGGGQAVNDPT